MYGISKELLKELRETIESALSFVNYSDTPIVWSMTQDKKSKALLIKEIEKRVATQLKGIFDIIAQIEKEYDPNTLTKPSNNGRTTTTHRV